MATSSATVPVRAKVLSAPVPAPASSPPNPSTASSAGIVRVSWTREERSPSEDDLQKYLLQRHMLGSSKYQVKMRLSRRSAFVACDRAEDAERIVQVKSAKVAGVNARFSLVPQSSLDEDYSCSVLVFGVQLPQKGDQEARVVTLIEEASDSSPDVALSRKNGDYDVLIISAEMALVFVDERKKDQLGSLAGNFIYPGVSNRCAPTLKAFNISPVPVEHRSKEILCSVFAQWRPEIVLHGDTAVITIGDPSTTVMGEVRACCESVAGQSVSIECPAELRDELASATVTEVEVESLPPDKLAYFGTIRKDPNVSVYVDGDVMHIKGPKHSCLEYKKMVETASLHALDSTLVPEIVRFLSTTPAKESLTELAKSCRCACLEPEASSAETKLVVVSEREAAAIACKDKLKRKYAVVSIPNPDHEILDKEAEGALECIKDCIEQENPGIQILLEGNIVKLVGERKDMTSHKEDVQKRISELLKIDEKVELGRDMFAVMKHSSNWFDIEDLGKRLDCTIIEPQSAGPNPIGIRVHGRTENVQKIMSRINELQESLVAKVIHVNIPGIQKVCVGGSCLLSTPSPSCSTQVTCVGKHLLRDVFSVVRGKISSQTADALFNSTNGGLSLRHGQIAPDLAAVAGPSLQRECSQYLKDHGPVQFGGIAVTGAGNLQAQFVLHGNVKTYSSRRPQESIASLQGVVRRALEECDRRRLQSIAFPAIGIGNLSFPPDVAIKALVGSAVDYLMQNRSATTIMEVILVGFEERARALFHSVLEQRLGLHPTRVVPRPTNGGDVHSGTVPDYPGLKLPTLHLDPPPRGTPPLGTPLEFSILAESADHCSRAEAEMQQNVDKLLKREEVADKIIEHLPTSFMTAFLASAEAAHVQVKIRHNPAVAELSGPKEDVNRAVDALRNALLMVSNHFDAIEREVTSELAHFKWQRHTSGPDCKARSLSREECYELEKARKLQRNTATINRGRSGQVTYDLERGVEVAAGATQISRVPKEEGFPRPKSWEGQGNVVELKKNCGEFRQIVTEFERSVKCKAIVKIERIQKYRLWQAYQAHKQEVLRVTPRGTPAERMLYHGCPSANVDGINTNGFTPKLAGTSNAMQFGQGVYFAQNASYSARDQYSVIDKKGHKHIYLCCVLTGVYKKGDSSMRVPPAMNRSTTKWCHSTVDDESNPTIFVIYENNMVYPQYLITFTMH